MTSQFSPKVSQILAFSREEAARLASRSVGPEHLLLGILRDKTGPVHELFLKLDINYQSIKTELEQKVREDDFMQPLNTRELVLNEKASNILKLAVLEARIQSMQMVDEQHLLLAILHDHANNGAKEVLEFNNMSYEDALTYFQNKSGYMTNDGIDMPDKDEDEDGMLSINGGNSQKSNPQSTATGVHRSQGKTPVLDNFGTDLTKCASEGKLDPVVGREREIQRVVEILCRRKKNNPILIGEPGVGKSAIVEGLAQLINKHHTSPVLFNKRIISLDMTAIVAGTKYRGQFEERIRALIKEIEQNPDVVIFIDEIHTLIGAGSTPGSMDAANILKPALARGTIQCIGATTLSEYRNSIEKDGALERRFQKVIVEPTTSDETITILNNIKERYENHHHVSYTNDAILACVKLTERYVTDRFFPDKAIDVLDEVGARVHLRHTQMPPEISEKEKEINFIKGKKQAAVRNQNFELAASYRDKQTELEAELSELQEKWANNEIGTRDEITENDVTEVVSMITGVPVQRMAEAESARLKNMANDLKAVVVAQDKAIEKMVKAIQRNRVGLKEKNHPIGAFMFLGPTGVGKTYLAKKLAEHMFGSSDALIRVDMSEYSESFNTSRLVGAPPGYVGYEEGGQLTEKVRRHPYSIVLLDEIEKAHPDVFNILLQVLDDGHITDAQGRKVDFKQTIIIMTSNAGAQAIMEPKRLGFMSDNDEKKDYERMKGGVMEEVRRIFKPEFLNRIDDIMVFHVLNKEDIRKIVTLLLKTMEKRCAEQMEIHLTVTNAVKDFIAEKGSDNKYGARPLRRAIQSKIEDALANEILEGRVKRGDSVQVKLHKNEIAFEVKKQ